MATSTEAQKLLELGRLVRTSILSARDKNATFSGITKHTSADTIYELDTHVEPIIIDFCEHWGRDTPLVLIAEGISEEGGPEGKAVFPKGTPESAAKIRLLIDPIDGTRGLMYDKRSAWFLAGIAPNRGDATRLSDITDAAQVELPTSKQNAGDLLWATKGHGTQGLREEVATGRKLHDLTPKPSQATTIAHGFASISNFFPGTKELASRLMEEIVSATLTPADIGQGIVFDDQYISTGGQFYELIMGHDRFNADLRPIFYKIHNIPPKICVHPYDAATVLIAREAGVLITDGMGGEFDGPLDVETPLAWAGFANATLRNAVEPVMIRILREWLKNPRTAGQLP